MNKTTNKYKISNKALLAIGTTAFCVFADNAYAGGLEDLSRKVTALVMGDLGKAVFGLSVMGGGAVALWTQNLPKACGIIGVGTLLGLFLSAINDGSFTRFITLG